MKKTVFAAMAALALTTTSAFAEGHTSNFSFGGQSSFGGGGFVNFDGGAGFGNITEEGYGSNNTKSFSDGILCGEPGCDGEGGDTFTFEGNAGEHIGLDGQVAGTSPDTDVVMTNATNGGAMITFSALTPDTQVDLGIAGAFMAGGTGAGIFSGGDGSVNIEEWGGGGTNQNLKVTGCITGDITCQNATYDMNVYAYDGVNVHTQVSGDEANVPVTAVNSGLAQSDVTMTFYKQ